MFKVSELVDALDVRNLKKRNNIRKDRIFVCIRYRLIRLLEKKLEAISNTVSKPKQTCREFTKGIEGRIVVMNNGILVSV